MTGAEHYAEAERLLAQNAGIDVTRIDTLMDKLDVEVRSQAALTHAILADIATRTDGKMSP